MKENVNQIFYEEIREKKTTATGVHGKKGKSGKVGKMMMPADLSGREYREARDLPGFNVYDFMQKLQEAPALKAVLLDRMDDEYRHYRQATEKALDAVAEVVKLGIEPLWTEVEALRERVAALAPLVEGKGAGPVVAQAGGAGRPALARQATAGRKRIRWGSEPMAIRGTVFEQLRQLLNEGEEISTEVIKQRIPSMLRWIYGQKAVFDGIEGLRRDFHASSWSGGRPARQAGAPAAKAADPAGNAPLPASGQA